MSSSFDDDDDDGSGLEDPTIDCYTHTAIVEILVPGSGEPAMSIDVEIIADRPLSTGELEARALAQAQPWINTLIDSPSFRARFGRTPQVNIVGLGVVFGC